MRITLDPIPLELTAAAPASGGEPARRQIAGLAVPYGVEARVGDRLVTFAADSVDVDGAPPLLLGHDSNRPVGVLVASSSDDDGLRATYAIDATADGDAALTQAQSGSRRGLSVGVDLDQFEADADDDERITVTAGRLAETSLVAMAAYPAAGVESIAAAQSNGGNMTEPTPVPDPEPEPQPAPAPEPVTPARGVVIADRDQPDMRLGEYVQTLVRAERGDRGARERIEAALTRGNLAGNPGVVPIAYVQGIIDGLGDDRPLYNAMSHAEMPSAGMTIRRPIIATRPDGAFIADDTAAAPSNAVAINNLDVTVKQWAWGGSASVALVERSSPSYVEEVFSQAIRSYHRDVEADIAAGFPAATGGAASLGAAVAAFMAAYRRYPTMLVCGGTAYGKVLDATGVLKFSSGTADASGSANIAGLRVVVSPDVATADAWVTLPEFQEIRESSPIRLSVSDVTSLSLEIGVTSFYSRSQTLPASGAVLGAVGIPGFTPVVELASAGKSK